MNTNVYRYTGSLYCGDHADEIRRQLHAMVEDGLTRCPNFEDSEQWPVVVDPIEVKANDLCDACVGVALAHNWNISIALLKE